MSLVRQPPVVPMHARQGAVASPRRGRPPARNEILRGGRLGGILADELAERYGTPFYAYDLDVVGRQVDALREHLPASFQIAYAVKANPALGVVAHLGRLGLGADVASGGELELASRARIPAERIVFTGPGKREDELRAAVLAGVSAITVESGGELRRLERVAADARRRVPILLRVAALPQPGRERIDLAGRDGTLKFGIDPAELPRVAKAAVASPHLDLLGIHAFGTSNVLEAAALAAHVEWTMATARRLAVEIGFPLRLVDVGGGLGIPYEIHEESLDLAGLGTRLAAIARAWADDPPTSSAAVLLEPGRFLVAAAGAYVTRVVDRKAIAGQEIAILDGGIHVLRPALVGQEHRVRRLTGAPGTGSRHAPITLAGPLCTGSDVLASQAILPPLAPGDLVAVLDVGAYGFTESMPFFLSHPAPPEIGIRAGRDALLRPRLEPANWLDWQADPLR